MILCSEKYLEKLDLVEALMHERQQLCTSMTTYKNRLKVIEENIRALNAEIHNLEKQLILKHYNH